MRVYQFVVLRIVPQVVQRVGGPHADQLLVWGLRIHISYLERDLVLALLHIRGATRSCALL